MTWEKALQSARRLVKQFTKEDIKTMHEISIGLKPRVSSRESKEQWYQKYEKNKIHYKLFQKTLKDEISVMRKMNKTSNKKEIQRAIAQAIREKQVELGLEKYLMNSVRLGLFNTMTRYFNNPKLRKD